MVKERITRLSHEFLIAIISVVIVTIILLPMRVALIAALAIPITLCGTLGVMDALGIALHQVSIAALIVVLGIVVDDAIVIADNYVELLDHKVPKAEAAWQECERGLRPGADCDNHDHRLVPAAPDHHRLRRRVHHGAPHHGSDRLGGFVHSGGLPDPAALQLFHQEGAARPRRRRGTRQGEERAARPAPGWLRDLIKVFMNRKWLAYTLGVAAFAFGVLLFAFVPQQFFPSAERNQFVIDVWMPQGTRIEATDAVMGRIEKALGSRKGVAHYATFVGQSAPRFYYNVNPQQPDGAYGQFIVNTASVKDTGRLVKELRPALAALAPEAMVIVKELQQGSQMEAPVEVRISGDDVGELKRLGEKVQGILEERSEIPSTSTGTTSTIRTWWT